MNRYLGTKTKILPKIADAISALGRVDSVCDIFAGSLAVSLFLKRHGFSIIANDINRLSYAYARCYLIPTAIPQFNIGKMLPKIPKGRIAELRHLAKATLSQQLETFDRENVWDEFQSWADYLKQFETISLVLAYLQQVAASSWSKLDLRTDVLDHYTKVGRNSSFRSLRGTQGKRNYFSPQNARHLDFILSHIRYWVQSGQLDEEGKYTLLSIVLDSMERCVNIHGTYHDFPRTNSRSALASHCALSFQTTLDYCTRKDGTSQRVKTR
jgi:adenine-specific DNA-methyltransferase